MATSKGLVGGANTSLNSAKWISFRASIILITLLVILMCLVGVEKIEIIIAVLSLVSNGISQLLERYFHVSPWKMFENNLIDMLDALGAAGVGTLIILYLLD